MTRREREVTDINDILQIINETKILHLGLSDEGWPYVVPMNYGYEYVDGKLTFYLHGATKGYKFDVLEKNPKVSFALVADVEEKEKALSLLMKQQTGKDFTFDEKLVSIVNVIRIDVKEFTAKERKLPAAMQQDSCK